MRIILISTAALPAPTGGSYGGLENVCFDSGAELAKLGNDVTLITTDESSQLGYHAAVDDDGNQKGYLDVRSAGKTEWNALAERAMYLRYREFVEKEAGDGQAVVINHSWFAWIYFSLTGGDLSGIKIAPHPKMKIISVIHGTTGWRRQTGEYVPPRTQFPRILGVSKGHAQYLSNCFKIPVRHVFNGIHLPSMFKATNSLDGRFEPPPKGDYLLSLNRISAEKGIHNAIDVALATGNRIKVVGDDTHVADPRYVWDIMNRCEESGGRAEYVGPVSNEEKWEYIRNCKALIACPDMVSYVEAFYLAAVEGFSQGKPLIALPNGGLNDLVVNGLNGFLCENAETMKEVLKDGAYILKKKMDGLEVGDQIPYYGRMIKLEDLDPASIRAEAEKYTVENMAKNYLDLCKGVLANDPAYYW